MGRLAQAILQQADLLAPSDEELTLILSSFLKLTPASEYLYDNIGRFYTVSKAKLESLILIDPQIQHLVDVQALRTEGNVRASVVTGAIASDAAGPGELGNV